ncbi:anthranilate synthase component I [Planifilum fimeticola]
MIYPPYAEVKRLAKNFSSIPLCKTIFADTETPVSLYDRLRDRPYSFLLESVEGGEKWARYSFIGADPFLIVTCRDGQVTLSGKEGTKRFAADPFNVVQDLLLRYRTPGYSGHPPFLGGAVGYIAYEAVRYMESLPPFPHIGKGTGARDLHLMFCDRVLIFDHLKQQVTLVHHLHVPEKPEEATLLEHYRRAVEELEERARRIRTCRPNLAYFHDPPFETRGEPDLSRADSNMSRHHYEAMVRRAQEHIRSGDIFQLVPSQRWTWHPSPPPFDVYRVLRILNPSPYMFYLKMGDEVVTGASPELLVRVTGRKVETRPIAGTRPRGRTAEEDERLEAELLRDEKERAEHVMLIDLGRNDLGRVCRYGTVRVTQQMAIERYSHVMHMVSHVTGDLAQGRAPIDALRAVFPAGTVSGAPKVRAMELIGELEPEPRGVYAGAVGYFSFAGNLDTCIAIRTLHFRDGNAYIQAGGGVVADSTPEGEYVESLNKAKGMFRALELAETLFKPIRS